MYDAGRTKCRAPLPCSRPQLNPPQHPATSSSSSPSPATSGRSLSHSTARHGDCDTWSSHPGEQDPHESSSGV